MRDGVAQACSILAEGLVNKGWQVTVATSQYSDDGLPNLSVTENVNGVTIERFKIKSYHGGKININTEESRYINYIKNGSFSIIISQCWDAWTTTLLHKVINDLNFLKVMVSHGYGKHVYIWSWRTTLGFGTWLRGLKWTFQNLPRMIKSYDKIIFLSDKKGCGRFFDKTMASLIGHSGIEVVPNSIDQSLFDGDDDTFRTIHGIGPGPMVLCVANYSEGKNQKLATQIFLKANVPRSTLVFIGSNLNSYGREALQYSLNSRNKSKECRVIFLEKIARKDIISAYKTTDIVLLTSRAETQPIVLIEAMAAGKPWISTNTGCVDRMEGGIVCLSHNELLVALKNLMNSPASRELLGAEGLFAARNQYASNRCVMKYDSILRALLPH